jgi:RDD family
VNDPTAVMGRRIGAAAIDTLAFAGVFLALFGLWSTSLDHMAGGSCDVLRAGGELTLCYQRDGHVHYVLGGRAWLVAVLPFALSVFNLVLIQAFTGATLGKALTGVRTVDAGGAVPGIGRAIGRWAFLAVDWFPWCVPVVGLATAITDRLHRRVGDRVLSTFVVARSAVGRPPDPGGTALPAPSPPGGAGSPLPPPPPPL